jgi:hypothetical protein
VARRGGPRPSGWARVCQPWTSRAWCWARSSLVRHCQQSATPAWQRRSWAHADTAWRCWCWWSQRGWPARCVRAMAVFAQSLGRCKSVAVLAWSVHMDDVGRSIDKTIRPASLAATQSRQQDITGKRHTKWVRAAGQCELTTGARLLAGPSGARRLGDAPRLRRAAGARGGDAAGGGQALLLRRPDGAGDLVLPQRGQLPWGAQAPQHRRGGECCQSKRPPIESRWVSRPLAFAGQLQPRRLNN